jgi:hypothetical protein
MSEKNSCIVISFLKKVVPAYSTKACALLLKFALLVNFFIPTTLATPYPPESNSKNQVASASPYSSNKIMNDVRLLATSYRERGEFDRIRVTIRTKDVPSDALKYKLQNIEEVSSSKDSKPAVSKISGEISIYDIDEVASLEEVVRISLDTKKRSDLSEIYQSHALSALMSAKAGPEIQDLVDAGYSKNQKIKVIIQTYEKPEQDLKQGLRSSGQNFTIFNGIPAEIKVSEIQTLLGRDDVAQISLDKPTKASADLTPYEGSTKEESSGLNELRLHSPATDGKGVGIAILDTGVDSIALSSTYANGGWYESAQNRVIANVNFVTGETTTADLNGHGTMVAHIAAGYNAYGKGGVANAANIINVRVLNAQGMGLTSDAIRGLEWVVTNRTTYNIKVINMSFGAGARESFMTDPLCVAVRKAVAAGIVVVTSAGNFGADAQGREIYGTITSPGIEPTAITVGAVNMRNTLARSDDTVAKFSSKGPTRSYRTVPTTTPSSTTTTTSSRINVASASNGGVATASSELVWTDYMVHTNPATSINDGDRTGKNFGNGGVWVDATAHSFPDWIQIAFQGNKTIDEIKVYTLQNNYWNGTEPTEQTSASWEGIKDFDVEYWNGSAWTLIPNGRITGNTNALRKFTFSPITTTKIRVVCKASNSGDLRFSKLAEIEAFSNEPVSSTTYTKIYDNVIKPDLVAPGNQILGIMPTSTYLDTTYPQTSYTSAAKFGNRKVAKLSGTSTSAPMVTGTVALMLQANPNLTPGLVRAILQWTAQPIPNTSVFAQGAGYLNVNAAVQLTKTIVPNPSTLAIGSNLLTGTLPPATTVIYGEVVKRSGLVFFNGNHVYGGDELFTKMQMPYVHGRLWYGDRIYNINPLELYAGQDKTVLTPGVKLFNETISSNNNTLNGNLSLGLTLSQGVVVSEGIVICEGIVVSEGIVICEGVVVSEGVIIAEGVIVSENILINGELP